jgi:hypothetical protein
MLRIAPMPSKRYLKLSLKKEKKKEKRKERGFNLAR